MHWIREEEAKAWKKFQQDMEFRLMYGRDKHPRDPKTGRFIKWKNDYIKTTDK